MTLRIRRGLGSSLFLASIAVLAALLFVACGGGSSPGASPQPSAPAVSSTSGAVTTTTIADVVPTAAKFVNINTMTRVGDHFVGSLNGHLAAALAVARSAKGGVYPVGTVVQLLPTEAMVKRRKGYSPSTGDWEFFSLDVSAPGTQIAASGPKVKNFSGADCASCHSLAKPQFDLICEKSHGCAPLGLSDAFIAKIQEGDPRPK